MICITYEQGEVSLLHAITAGKSLIQYRPAGTECFIEQRSKTTLVQVRMVVDKDGAVSEDINASPVLAPVVHESLSSSMFVNEQGNLELKPPC